ncbi:hypothetical protein CGRA01v4_00859 [Colletotrichum graminicola]|uniref:Uncharacterized protein n=1 Tax=Colletotrichum graminicola (strain M1.001 / M2 / FGSC 10212) TaxID=645133 RepID=E3QRD1_COLGM|nr:uncharacterized protein GLRG_08698 [Colletotrichum graminicola M1.001]EFQ33419.1 hypothetical protein GLRG_08698 [Colletotrichum graminicola M1.001]WDK09581.1 hypothetical protein CGRA01v4_00859 [Colletotrichum graminicola]
MATPRGTAARLRRTFHYPTDDDSADSQADVMDEEEQEVLIQRLADENAARNAQFNTFLIALPLLTTIPYLISLFRLSAPLTSLLSITSLLSTAFLLHTQPPDVTGIALLDAWSHPKTPRGSPSSSLASSTSSISGASSSSSSSYQPVRTPGRTRRRRSSFSLVKDQKSPLETYLPYLNLGLCAVLVLTGFVTRSGERHALGQVGLGNLPAIVYVVTLIAKVVMGSVDPEKELAALKYDLKGV